MMPWMSLAGKVKYIFFVLFVLVDLLPDDFVLDFDVLTELLDLLELPVFPDALPDLLLEDVVLLDEVPDE